MGIFYNNRGKAQKFQKSGKFKSPEWIAVERDLTYGDTGTGLRPEMMTEEWQKGKKEYDNEKITVDTRNAYEKRADDVADWGDSISEDLSAVPRFFNEVGTQQTRLAGDFSRLVTGGSKYETTRKDAVNSRKADSRIDAAKHIGTELALTYGGTKLGKYIGKTPAFKKLGLLYRENMDEMRRLAKIAKKEIDLMRVNKWSDNWYSSDEFKKRMLDTSENHATADAAIKAINDNITEAVNKLYSYSPKGAAGSKQITHADILKDPRLIDGLTPFQKQEYQKNLGYLDDMYRDMAFLQDMRIPDEEVEGVYKIVMDRLKGGYSHVRRATPSEERLAKENGWAGKSRHREMGEAAENIVADAESTMATGAHEANHGLTLGDKYIPRNVMEFFIKHKPKMPKGLTAEELKAFNYYTKPTEVWARIMAIRKLGNLKPGQIVDDKLLAKVLKKSDIFSIRRMRDYYSDEAIKDLLNKLPAATGITTGAYKASQMGDVGGES